jgi:AcrR family transcriptional regulator
MVDSGHPRDVPRSAGSPDAQVNEAYRARILAVARELVRERGFGGLEVSELAARANVGRRIFYELLESRERCFQIVLEDTVARLQAVMRDAFAAAEPAGWWTGLRAALATLLAFLEDEPGLGSALLVDTLDAGPAVLEYRARVLKNLVATVNRAPTHLNEVPTHPAPGEPLPLTAEWVVAGALGMIQSRLLLQQRSPQTGAGPGTFTDLVNPLMALTVLPYAGWAAAQDELDRPLTEVKRPWASPPSDPLPDLGIRITLRRLLVLGAIAHTPGLSSFEVAEEAGIKDKGQASKLLARLEDAGLIEDPAQGRSGRPKAWRLTGLGVGVWRGLS